MSMFLKKQLKNYYYAQSVNIEKTVPDVLSIPIHSLSFNCPCKYFQVKSGSLKQPLNFCLSHTISDNGYYFFTTLLGKEVYCPWFGFNPQEKTTFPTEFLVNFSNCAWKFALDYFILVEMDGLVGVACLNLYLHYALDALVLSQKCEDTIEGLALGEMPSPLTDDVWSKQPSI